MKTAKEAPLSDVVIYSCYCFTAGRLLFLRRIMSEMRGFVMNDSIEKNLQMLERGISLQEYVDRKDEVLIKSYDYKDHGIFAIYNTTKNIYLLNRYYESPYYSIDYVISDFILTDSAGGNPYMHQHYMEGDEFILRYHRFDRNRYDSLAELERDVTLEYDKYSESYYDYLFRMKDLPRQYYDGREDYNKYYSGRLPKRNTVFALKLLYMEQKSALKYEALNAIVDILIKSILFFILFLPENTYMLWGETVGQKCYAMALYVIGNYLAAIKFYLIFCGFAEVMRLLLTGHRIAGFRIRIFDIIVKWGMERIQSVDV